MACTVHAGQLNSSTNFMYQTSFISAEGCLFWTSAWQMSSFLSCWRSFSLIHSKPQPWQDSGIWPHAACEIAFVISAVYVTWIRNILFSPYRGQMNGMESCLAWTGPTTDQRDIRGIFKTQVLMLAFPVKARGGKYYSTTPLLPPFKTHKHAVHAPGKQLCSFWSAVWEHLIFIEGQRRRKWNNSRGTIVCVILHCNHDLDASTEGALQMCKNMHKK